MAIETNITNMSRDELKAALPFPQTWLGWNALDIKLVVIKAGGWRRVFPDELPKWAHFLRQMFNEEPESIRRKGDSTAEIAIQNSLGSRALNSNIKNHIAAKNANSGDVYGEFTKDRFGKDMERMWIEQSQAGTQYHYKKGQEMPEWLHVGYAAFTTHSSTNAFKLCSPDGTDGSNEACFYNHSEKRNLLTNIEDTQYVRNQAIKDDKYRGSYNYADTMATGFDLHDKYDMETDKKWGQDYVDEKQFSPLTERYFEPRHFIGENL